MTIKIVYTIKFKLSLRFTVSVCREFRYPDFVIINNSPIRMRQTCCGSMICTKHAAGGRGPRWPILAVDGAENRSDTYSCRYM
jgi:hypothetical protein